MKFVSAFCCVVFALLVFAAIRDSDANPDYACYGRPAGCATLRTVH
jgi:hypothetical protein